MELPGVTSGVVGEKTVEIQVRGVQRVAKLIKLGDEIAVDGESTINRVPNVVSKYDAKRSGQFTPDPGAKSVSLLSPTILEERSSEACRFWLSDSKCRRNEEGICRFAHPTPSSVEFLEARAKRLALLEEKRSKKVHFLDDPHAGKKAKRSQRANIFAEWILKTFGVLGVILDVAGGKGELSRELLRIGACKSVILVDPRCNVRKFDGLSHRKEFFGPDWNCGESKIDLVVGMHIDQVTEPAIEWAFSRRIPFAVVPCCVFVDLFPRQGRVHCYEELILWLVERFEAKKDYLALQGRNVVIFGTE